MTFQEKYAKDLENMQNTLQDEINKVDVDPYVDRAFKLICNKFDSMVKKEYTIRTIHKKLKLQLGTMPSITTSFSLTISISTKGIWLNTAKKPCVVFHNVFWKNEIREYFISRLKEKLNGVGIDFRHGNLCYIATLNLKSKVDTANS